MKTDEAKALVEAMPTVASLMPPLQTAEIIAIEEANGHKRRDWYSRHLPLAEGAGSDRGTGGGVDRDRGPDDDRRGAGGVTDQATSRSEELLGLADQLKAAAAFARGWVGVDRDGDAT